MSRLGHRFFVDEPLVPGRSLVLPDDRSQQITRVLRLGVDDQITLFNGDGQEFAATIREARKRAVMVEVGAPSPGRPTPRPPVHLAIGLLKSDRFSWVVQKATELGVARIIPLETERTVVSLTASRAEQRRDRWFRIAVEAAEQSGRVTVPEIAEPMDLRALLAASQRLPMLLCWEDEPAQPLAAAVPAGDRPLVVIIGPEGGFTSAEVAEAVTAGVQPVSLGPLILRSETAALAALAGIYALAAAGVVDDHTRDVEAASS